MLAKILHKLLKPEKKSITESSSTDNSLDDTEKAVYSNFDPTPEKLAKAICHIVSTSSEPVSIGIISMRIRKSFPSLYPIPIYNPRIEYQVGQMIYHASPKYEKWFTVVETNGTIMTALFDNGAEIRLEHGNPKISWRPTFSTGAHTLISKIALELVKNQRINPEDILSYEKTIISNRDKPSHIHKYKKPKEKKKDKQPTQEEANEPHKEKPTPSNWGKPSRIFTYKKPTNIESGTPRNEKQLPPNWGKPTRILKYQKPNSQATKFQIDHNKKNGAGTQFQKLKEKHQEHLRLLRETYRIESLYHITKIENLPGILNRGLICHNNIHHYADISNPEIQNRRHAKRIPQDPSLTIHDCVPLFFAPLSPMLSARREQEPIIIYLHIDPAALFLPGTIFTDGNASSNSTVFYQRLDFLSNLDWNILRANFWGDPNPEVHQENKRKRSAEVLVPGRIPVSFIRTITTYNREMRQRVIGILESSGLNIVVRENPDFYFTGSHYMDYSIEIDQESPSAYQPGNRKPEPPPNFREDVDWYI
jgi:hypothetical protein